jgi:hypothetical protein
MYPANRYSVIAVASLAEFSEQVSQILVVIRRPAEDTQHPDPPVYIVNRIYDAPLLYAETPDLDTRWQV